MNTQERSRSLHIHRQGAGAPLVALHGWGWSGRVFESLLAGLDVEQWRLDLPGHGESPWWPLTQAGLVRQLESQLPRRMVLLGWSLGGLIALAFARALPERVSGLFLLASNPRFVQADDWPGQPAAILAQFARDLQQDNRRTLQRFVALQGMTAAEDQGQVRQLRQWLACMPAAQAPALEAGLQWLRDWDLRKSLAQLPMPVQFVLGGQDRLVPPQLAEALAATNPALHIKVIETAGHVPFISHATMCRQLLQQRLREWC